MKTEKEIKERLKAKKKRLKAVTIIFNKHDNLEDMHEMEELETELAELNWVLTGVPSCHAD